MANIIISTEACDDTDDWTPSNVTVTADTHAAPNFAGPLAGMADTLADNSGSVQGALTSTYYDIAADTSDYVASVYIRKDAVTDRWPDMSLQLVGGTTVFGYVNINTSTGSIADGDVAPVTKGVVDVDATWWRVWWQIANNNNTAIRVNFFPDHKDALGGGNQGTGTGSTVVWGFNITQSTTVQAYEPQPFYDFNPPATSENLFYRRRR